jgi:hypothetical protein
MDRRLRALAQVEARELKSLETALVKEQRVKTRARGGGNRMPASTLDLKPRGRRDAAMEARNRHGGRAALDEAAKTPPEAQKKTLSLREDFMRAAGDGGADGSGRGTGGSSEGASRPTPPNRTTRSAAAAATGISIWIVSTEAASNRDRGGDDYER